jgi:peptidoglycan/LPS O-acetylase OafA/YrhL
MTQDHRTDIDGLRAVAVLLVVAFHVFPLSPSGGFIGVDVFFVISGYLITGLILDQQATSVFSIRNFYIRRARRILPALAVVLATTLLIGWIVLYPAPYERLGLHAVAGALFFPNLIYWGEAGYFDDTASAKPLLHLWSLGVEEQFYLVWPLLLILLRRWKAPLTVSLCALSAASLIYSSIAAYYDPIAAFYSPLSRLWELGAGGILASQRIKLPIPKTTSFLGLALIVWTAFTITDASVFPGLLALIPVGATAMVIVGRSSVLSSRVAVAIGQISYPLYLWHWPLLSFAVILDFHTELAKALVVVVSFFLAWMTTRYVEFPIRFGGLRPRGAAISVAAMFAISIGAFMIFYFDGIPDRYPPEIRPVLATREYDFRGPGRYRRCWDPYGGYAPECRDGKILVWGDSYSGSLATGLPMPYAQFTASGCAPLLIAGTGQCAVNNAWVVDEIQRLKPQRVILFARWDLYAANGWSDQKLKVLQYTLHKLGSSIDDVILLGPSPEWWPNLPDVVFRSWSRVGVLPDRLVVPAKNYHAADEAMRNIANNEHVRYISIFDALCDAEGCLTHTPASKSELLVWDHGHMTRAGATYIVQKLGLAELDPQQVQ